MQRWYTPSMISFLLVLQVRLLISLDQASFAAFLHSSVVCSCIVHQQRINTVLPPSKPAISESLPFCPESAQTEYILFNPLV